MTTTTTTDIGSHVEALAKRDPAWLADLRREALARFHDLPMPVGREEHWRFTDVAKLDPRGYTAFEPGSDAAVASTPAAAAAALELTDLSPAGRIVNVDGTEISLELSDAAREAGVTFCSLDVAVREHADLLRPRLGTLVAPDDVFKAWSLAAHQGGVFLHVPRGVRVTDPFQSVHWMSRAGAAVLPRTVVVVEEDAEVVFNDLYLSEELGARTLCAPAVEVFCGRGAKVGWVTWQDLGTDVNNLMHVKAHLDRDATLNTLLVTLGGDLSRAWKECTLAGEGAESYMYGLYFPHGTQRFEHWTVQDHAAPHTTSDLLYKGALADETQALYYGTIRVRPGAYRTDAYQANRNLALSAHARALPNPQLEIENNDVRCTHGATVGQVDEDHLFYLQSRGIPREEAKRLIVFGFFNEVLGRVTWSGMHERLAEAIRAKMEEAR